MTDAPAPRRLAELYRASMPSAPAVPADALLAALDGVGGREARDEILSLALDHPAQAALIRSLVSLRTDVDALQREVRALRKAPARTRPLWAAMAASLALAAVVVVGLRPGMAPVPAEGTLVQGGLPDSDRISSVSFESPADSSAEAPLFRGSFDS